MKRMGKKITFLLVVALALCSLSGAAFGQAPPDNEEVLANILVINDLHGSYAENQKIGAPGLARIAALVKDYEARYPGKNILLSAGDNYTDGNKLGTRKGADIVNAVYKKMNLQASAVGENDYAWGGDQMNKWEVDGDFIFLDGNTTLTAGFPGPLKFTDYGYLEADGYRIGFIGASTKEMEKLVAGPNKTGYFHDPLHIRWNWTASKLEGAGCQLVFALTHVPAEQTKSGKILGETQELFSGLYQALLIDGIITGQSHSQICGFLDIGGEEVPVVQGEQNGAWVSLIQVQKGKGAGAVVLEPSLISPWNYQPDWEIKELIASMKAA